MAKSVAMKLIERHLVSGRPVQGEEIGIRIDQTLTQDATGTLVMLELEAMGLDRVRTELSVQYVDHNLVQEDSKNPDDHLYLLSACRRLGIWYSRPGNGVSHPVHQECFGRPGVTLLGADSHTPAAGALGMLAIGAGGMEVALAMAGEPFYFEMPAIWGIRLVGSLPPWVSAKDVILEMLRRHGVAGGRGRILEYFGPGLAELSAWDRHVIANMGTELGATSTVFPADKEVRRYLEAQGRGHHFTELLADGTKYDLVEELDLSTLEPLVALPSSPGNVVPVASVAGQEIHQAYIGSSANPGVRDFAVVAEIVRDRTVAPHVSLDINPSTRQVLSTLTRAGYLNALIEAGARIHQTGCNGCIGMGQAPATGKISVRTVPRNFPGRSGTLDDKVCLVSPETAAASALTGRLTDPRTLGDLSPRYLEAPPLPWPPGMMLAPLPPEEARAVVPVKGPNIESLPVLEATPDSLRVPVLLTLGDDVSTDEILPAGARVLPYRSNIPKISEFCFRAVDSSYPRRARSEGAHAIVAGHNYGQGSSREHAALAPRTLGLRLVVAASFSRIHRQNLVNFGVLPLTVDFGDEQPAQGDVLEVTGLHEALRRGGPVRLTNTTRGTTHEAHHRLSGRQVDVLVAGGLVNWVRSRL